MKLDDIANRRLSANGPIRGLLHTGSAMIHRAREAEREKGGKERGLRITKEEAASREIVNLAAPFAARDCTYAVAREVCVC